MEADAGRLRVTRLGAVSVLLAVAGWGLTSVILKIVAMSAPTFAFYRLWLGALIMLVALALTGRRPTVAMIRSSLLPGVLFGASLLTFFQALRLTNVADVLVIQALQPPLVLLAARPLFGEPVTRFDVLWTLASIVGVALVTVGTSGTPTWSLSGDVFAVLSLIVWTAYLLRSKQVRATVPATEYMTTVTLVAALVTTPLALFSGEPLWGFPIQDWWWLALFLVAAQVGHVTLAWAHEQVDVSISSLILLLQGPIAVAAATVFLEEPLPPLAVVGGLLAIGSVAIIVSRASRAGRGETLPAPEVD